MPQGVDDMIHILSRIKELLAGSAKSDWAALTPTEVMAILDGELKSLAENHRLQNKTELESLFLPTAEIQEISMTNGWSAEYLLLSSRFDNALMHCS
jgi:hypothetical protein